MWFFNITHFILFVGTPVERFLLFLMYRAEGRLAEVRGFACGWWLFPGAFVGPIIHHNDLTMPPVSLLFRVTRSDLPARALPVTGSGFNPKPARFFKTGKCPFCQNFQALPSQTLETRNRSSETWRWTSSASYV